MIYTLVLLTQMLEKISLKFKASNVWNCLPTSLKNPAQFINLRRQSRYVYNHVSLILCDMWIITIFFLKYITSYTNYCVLLHVGQVCLSVWVCAWAHISLLWAASCDERFFAFLAARHRAILFSIFVLLIFIARWQINMTMMTTRATNWLGWRLVKKITRISALEIWQPWQGNPYCKLLCSATC